MHQKPPLDQSLSSQPQQLTKAADPLQHQQQQSILSRKRSLMNSSRKTRAIQKRQTHKKCNIQGVARQLIQNFYFLLFTFLLLCKHDTAGGLVLKGVACVVGSPLTPTLSIPHWSTLTGCHIIKAVLYIVLVFSQFIIIIIIIILFLFFSFFTLFPTPTSITINHSNHTIIFYLINPLHTSS